MPASAVNQVLWNAGRLTMGLSTGAAGTAIAAAFDTADPFCDGCARSRWCSDAMEIPARAAGRCSLRNMGNVTN
jgi:hypothetical protein